MIARPIIPPFAGILSLVCSKCTKQGHFHGKDRTAAAQQAKEQGWSMPVEGRFNCPRCTKVFGTKGAA